MMRIFKYRIFTSYKRLLFIGVVLAMYWYSRFLGYYSFKSDYFGINLFDIIFGFGFVYLFFTFLTNICNLEGNKELDFETSQRGFYHDKPIEDKREDFLGFQLTVDEFYSSIMSTIENDGRSLSIGITGIWGQGKSSFVALLMKKFEASPKKHIVLSFNPRHSKSKDLIQQDFFQSLMDELEIYDTRLSKSFSNYLKAINVVDDTKLFDFLNQGHDTIFDKEDEKAKINAAIARIDKKIVVFIDDLDRLLDDEIIEVCKLLDGNASFINMLFITAYDKEYVNSMLEKYNHGTGNFIDKFFTVEKSLPYVSKGTYTRYLVEELDRIFKGSISSSQFEEISKFARTNLLTLRDYKRFLNRFVDDYGNKINGVDFVDFFLLTLIDFRWRNNYEAIRDMKIVETFNSQNDNHKDQHKIYISNDGQKFSAENKDISFLNEETSEVVNKELIVDKDFSNLFSALFGNTITRRERGELAINKKSLFDNYFKPYVNKLSNPSRIEKMFKLDIDANIPLIDNFFDEKQVDYLFDYLTRKDLKLIENTEDLYRFAELVIYVFVRSKDYNLKDKLLVLITEKVIEQLKRTSLIEDKRLYKEKIRELFMKYSTYEFIGDLLVEECRGLRNDDNYVGPYVFNKNELLDINRTILTDFKEKEQIFKKIHLQVLYKCIDSISKEESRQFQLDKEACILVRDLIVRDPKEYFDDFIRLESVSSSPDWNGIACEPFWAQIFADDFNTDNIDEITRVFKDFIFSADYNDYAEINTIRIFWSLYENNNYEPIRFERNGDVQDKIDSGLVKEKEQLDAIFDIKKEFDELENRMGDVLKIFNEDNSNSISGHFFIKRCLDSGIEIEFLYNDLCVLRKLINELSDEKKFDLNLDILRVLRNFDMQKLKLYEGIRGLDAALNYLEKRRDDKLKLDLLNMLETSMDLHSRLKDLLNQEGFELTKIEIAKALYWVNINRQNSEFNFDDLNFVVYGNQKKNLADYTRKMRFTISGKGYYKIEDNSSLSLEKLELYDMEDFSDSMKMITT